VYSNNSHAIGQINKQWFQTIEPNMPLDVMEQVLEGSPIRIEPDY